MKLNQLIFSAIAVSCLMVAPAPASVLLVVDGEIYGGLTEIEYRLDQRTLVVRTFNELFCESETDEPIASPLMVLELDDFNIELSDQVELIFDADATYLSVQSVDLDLVCVSLGTPIFTDFFAFLLD